MAMKCRTGAILVWLLLATPTLALQDYWKLPIPSQGDAPETHHPITRDLSPQSCALCHPKQFEQWRGSFHAKAFSKGLVGQLPAYDEETQSSCLTCHAPRHEQYRRWEQSGIAALSKVHGVDCASCHVRHHQRYGPEEKSGTPHGRVKRLDLFRQSSFCAPCHQFSEDGERTNGKLLENTYQEWLSSPYTETEQTCQHCHMPDKNHTFLGIHDPGITRKGLKLEAHRQAQGIHVKASNAGAGHALPTYPTPRIRILIEAAGGGKQRREYVIQRHLRWDQASGWQELSDTRLMPQQHVDLKLDLMADQEALVTVDVEPDAFYHDHVYPSLFSLIGEDLDPDAFNVLKVAARESAQTKYTLYQLKCDGWRGKEMPCTQIIP